MKKQGRPRKRIEDYPECLAEGCKRSTKGGAKSFCHSHYIACRRGHLSSQGEWIRPVEDSRGRLRNHKYAGMDCKGPRCSSQAAVKGFCRRHYQQFRQGILDESGKQVRPLLAWQRPRKKSRWVDPAGYVLVYATPNHPGARMDGTILEHRLIMESILGRHLLDEEIVHHRNGKRDDNRPENLMVLDGRARRNEGHPPGHEVDPADVKQQLEHLKHNDPESFATIVKELRD